MSFRRFGQHAPRESIEPGVLETPAASGARPSGARSELVARAVTLLRDHVTEPVTMAELSRRIGVSERTLRAAFHDVLGLSPKQYALGQRLRAAREALCAADPKTTTVTDIATAYGFFELGRFAGRYRSAFGEMPSETLHQVARRWSEEAA
jgi:transcriptional regulator GlxA family with amidase domain